MIRLGPLIVCALIWNVGSPVAPASSGGTVTGAGHRLGATLDDAAHPFTETPICCPGPGVQDAATAGRFVFLFSNEAAEFEDCCGNPFSVTGHLQSSVCSRRN